MSEKPYYETMYILRPDIPEEEVDSHIKNYNEMLINSGAEVLDSQMRGKRRLAYPIAKHKEGIYVQLSHKGDGQQVAVMERAMRLSEDVIRYLTVKQNGPLPTPKSSAKDDSEKLNTAQEEVKATDENTEIKENEKKKELTNKENNETASEEKELK